MLLYYHFSLLSRPFLSPCNITLFHRPINFPSPFPIPHPIFHLYYPHQSTASRNPSIHPSSLTTFLLPPRHLQTPIRPLHMHQMLIILILIPTHCPQHWLFNSNPGHARRRRRRRRRRNGIPPNLLHSAMPIISPHQGRFSAITMTAQPARAVQFGMVVMLLCEGCCCCCAGMVVVVLTARRRFLSFCRDRVVGAWAMRRRWAFETGEMVSC